MARVPPVCREILPSHLQESFDRAVVNRGNPNAINAILLYSPEASALAHHWADYLRNDPGFVPKRLRQLAMLVVAQERNCQYIWNAHSEISIEAGLSSELVHALRDRLSVFPSMSPDEAAVIEYGHEYFRTGKVSNVTFANVSKFLGTRGLLELTMLMGYYAMLAFTATAFEVEVPPTKSVP